MRSKLDKVEHLRQVVAKTTRMLARQDIRVTQMGTGAFCKWERSTGKVIQINLPIIPPDPSEEYIAALQGFLDHEVAHALYTNPGEEQAVAEQSEVQGVGVKFRHNVVNVIEDVRIENAQAEHFPGSIVNMEATRRYMADKVWKPAFDRIGDISSPEGANQARGYAVVPWLRALGGHKACAELVAERNLDDLFKAVLIRIPDLSDRLKSMKSTGDAARLADLLLSVMDPPPKTTTPSPPEDEHAGEEPKAQDEDEGEGAESSSDDDANDGDQGDQDDQDESGMGPEDTDGESEEDGDDGDDGAMGSDDEADEGADGETGEDDEGDGSGSGEGEGGDLGSGSESDPTLKAALKQLSPNQRRALFLYNKKRQTTVQVAADMKCSESEVIALMKTGRRLVKNFMARRS